MINHLYRVGAGVGPSRPGQGRGMHHSKLIGPTVIDYELNLIDLILKRLLSLLHGTAWEEGFQKLYKILILLEQLYWFNAYKVHLEIGCMGIGCMGIGCMGIGCMGIGCMGIGCMGIGCMGLEASYM